MFTLAVGMVNDRYEALGSPAGGFLLISGIMLIPGICNFPGLLGIKNQKQERKVQKEAAPFL